MLKQLKTWLAKRKAQRKEKLQQDIGKLKILSAELFWKYGDTKNSFQAFLDMREKRLELRKIEQEEFNKIVGIK